MVTKNVLQDQTRQSRFHVTSSVLANVHSHDEQLSRQSWFHVTSSILANVHNHDEQLPRQSRFHVTSSVLANVHSHDEQLSRQSRFHVTPSVLANVYSHDEQIYLLILDHKIYHNIFFNRHCYSDLTFNLFLPKCRISYKDYLTLNPVSTLVF